MNYIIYLGSSSISVEKRFLLTAVSTFLPWLLWTPSLLLMHVLMADLVEQHTE